MPFKKKPLYDRIITKPVHKKNLISGFKCELYTYRAVAGPLFKNPIVSKENAEKNVETIVAGCYQESLTKPWGAMLAASISFHLAESVYFLSAKSVAQDGKMEKIFRTFWKVLKFGYVSRDRSSIFFEKSKQLVKAWKEIGFILLFAVLVSTNACYTCAFSSMSYASGDRYTAKDIKAIIRGMGLHQSGKTAIIIGLLKVIQSGKKLSSEFTEMVKFTWHLHAVSVKDGCDGFKNATILSIRVEDLERRLTMEKAKRKVSEKLANSRKTQLIKTQVQYANAVLEVATLRRHVKKLTEGTFTPPKDVYYV